MNYQTVLSKATKTLKGQLIKNPKLDCEILLSNALKIEREKLLINLNQEINEKDLNNFNNLINRRKRKEPIAYIIGYKEFWKKKFKVNTSVLIPRPDTEHLVEEALKLIPNNSSLNILDIGTGSGCIILSILYERNKCYGVALDISKKAGAETVVRPLELATDEASSFSAIEHVIKTIDEDFDFLVYSTADILIPSYIFKYVEEMNIYKSDKEFCVLVVLITKFIFLIIALFYLLL